MYEPPANRSKPTVFINARVIDPASGLDEPGGVLVEGDLVDAELFGPIGQEADQRLTDGAGADDVDDPLALTHDVAPQVGVPRIGRAPAARVGDAPLSGHRVGRCVPTRDPGGTESTLGPPGGQGHRQTSPHPGWKP